MTDTGCACKSGCRTHCNDHVRKFMQDMASRVVDGTNVCAKVGAGHWNRRVATCDIDGGIVVLREGGNHAHPIWRAALSSIEHTEFPGGIQRFTAPGVDPLFLFVN